MEVTPGNWRQLQVSHDLHISAARLSGLVLNEPEKMSAPEGGEVIPAVRETVGLLPQSCAELCPCFHQVQRSCGKCAVS